jgi:hypothetical protein
MVPYQLRPLACRLLAGRGMSCYGPFMRPVTPRSHRRSLAMLAVASLVGVQAFAASPAQAEPMYPFRGGGPTPTVADLAPDVAPEDEYSESLAFTAWLEDGTRVGINFAITNIGVGSRKGGVGSKVVFPNGQTVRFTEEVGKSWTAKAEGGKLEYIIGPGRVDGRMGRLTVSLNHARLNGTITFTGELPAYRPGNGRVYFNAPAGEKNSRFYDYLVVMPRAKVSGRLNAGGRPLNVVGRGWIERSRVNLYPFDQAVRWRAFTVYKGDTSVVMNEFVASPKYGGRRVSWLLVGDKGRIVYRTFNFQYTPSDLKIDPGASTKYQVPWSFDLLAQTTKDGQTVPKVQGTLKASKIVSRDDTLAEMGALTRAVVARFARPISYAMRCTYDLNINVVDGQEPQKLQGEDAECWLTFVK